MARNATDIIWKAEEQVVIYLRKALRQSQTQGYVGEFPVVMPNVDELGHWEFDIGAGSEWTQHRSDIAPPACIEMGAEFRGVFRSRKVAQRLAGSLLNAIPTGRKADGTCTISGVARLQFESNFTIGREEFVVDDTNDGAESGSQTMWVLVWPMKIVLSVPETS